MAKIVFNVPDAWVGENEVVYGIVEEGIPRADTVDRMNKALAEWDYPQRLTDHRDCGAFWIDPYALISEADFGPKFRSDTPIGSWVEILFIDTEEIPEKEEA